MATCPKGHASTDEDYCSDCGALIDKSMSALVNSAPAPLPSGSCPNCGELREGSAKFCEVCRYDFESGIAGAVQPAADPVPLPVTSQDRNFVRWRVSLTVDVSLSADPAAAAMAPVQEPLRTFPLDLPELLIGRVDEKRGIHPEILPHDSGISRRHAQFVRQNDGSFVLVDLNSTNGTTLNGRLIEPGVPTPVTDGDVITIGQWTRLTIQGFTA